MARSTARVEAVAVKLLLPWLRDALEPGDIVAQPLVDRLQLFDLCRHRLHVKERAIQAHLVVPVLRLELLAAEAQAR
eukprot:1356014-Pleurochrysis_carterae.AAC.1